MHLRAQDTLLLSRRQRILVNMSTPLLGRHYKNRRNREARLMPLSLLMVIRTKIRSKGIVSVTYVKAL